MLKRHLRVDHQTTPVEYRRKWGLPLNYPIVAPDYAKPGEEDRPRAAAGQRRPEGNAGARLADLGQGACFSRE